MRKLFSRSPGNSERQGRARKARVTPRLEQLEGRVVMSTLNPSNPSGGGTGGGPPFGSGVGYSFTNWPVGPLSNIQLSSDNTQPIVGPKGQGIRVADWIVRDPFPITNLDGSLAKIGGYYVVAGLATPRNDTLGTLREIDYIYSRDGVNWAEGGALIGSKATAGIPGGLGDQLFSGDIRYDASQNRLLIYYTPVTGSGTSDYPVSPSGPQIPQQIAVATETPNATGHGLTFTNFTQYGIQLEPDGAWYAKPETANTETEVVGFRDPNFFHDPVTGQNFLTFCANWGTDQTVGVGSTGDQKFPNAGPENVDPTLPRNDAAIGIAVATDKTLLHWKLLPPVFGAIGVNEQTELPHIIYDKGRYYLFTSTHDRTFVEDLKYKYPEGMYGFVASSLSGPYQPLNGTGLVIADPPADSLQNYAWKAVSVGGDNLEVISFINKGNSGTISPALGLHISGNSVTISAIQPGTGRPSAQLPLLFGVTATTSSLPPVTGGGNGGQGQGADSQASVFVVSVYESLLGRDPTEAERANWVNNMNAGQGVSTVYNAVLNSPERRFLVMSGRIRTTYSLYNILYVDQLYGSLLNRAPESSGLLFWLRTLQHGQSRNSVFRAFVSSPEYHRLHGIA